MGYSVNEFGLETSACRRASLSLFLSLSPLKCQNGEGVSVISSFCVRAPAMFALLPRRSQSGSTAPFIQATNFPCDGCDPRATIRVLDRRCLYLFRGISLTLFSLIFLMLNHFSVISRASSLISSDFFFFYIFLFCD